MNVRESVDNLVQIVDIPPALPGKCAVCGYAGGGGGNFRRFVDWGISLDFYGAVIFCTFCIEHVANLLGYLSPEQGEKLELELTFNREKVSLLGEENARLRSALSSLDFVSSATVVANETDEREGQSAPGTIEPDSSGRSESIPDSESSPSLINI